MSGHSKWSTIKRQKGVADTKRSQIFTKLAKEITVAAREGDPDPHTNARLRLAVQKARDNNMPLDNIERAIKRATGSAEGAALVELTLEAYGPGGSAILLQALTDNRNRTLSDVRSVLNRGGANMGESGCVSWLFDTRGVITVEASDVDPEDLALQAIDAGADDVKIEQSSVEIHTQPRDLEAVRKALEEQGVGILSAELLQVPKSLVSLDADSATQALKLLEKLEELDDLQHVFTNADFPDEVLETYRE
jgi:YebC/PmpR family DNA-binding regulatory protein